MNSYDSRPLLPMPCPKPLAEMTDEELTRRIVDGSNYNIIIPALIEAYMRKNEQIAELTKRIVYLEQKALKKPGRKKETFHYAGHELTDEHLMRVIDEGYCDSIGKLEKEVGAGKNQLRNRYNKAKEKLRLERQVERYGNS